MSWCRCVPGGEIIYVEYCNQAIYVAERGGREIFGYKVYKFCKVKKI